MEMLILHLIGDYVIQSNWMAINKTRSTWAALCHAVTYSIPFLLIGSITQVLLIGVTHLIIDRFRLVRYVIFLKNNLLGPVSEWKQWSDCSNTGFHDSMQPWMAVWLMIITDNVIHLVINYVTLTYV